MSKYIMVGCPGFKEAKVIEELTPRLHETFSIKYNIELGRKAIHLIRDGRSVVHSRMRRGHQLDTAVIRKYGLKLEGLDMHKKWAILWKTFVEAGIKNRGDPNYLEITYEDLCNKPKTTLRKVAKFLGQEYNPKIGKKFKLELKPNLTPWKKFGPKTLKEINEIINPTMEKVYGMEK